MNGALAARVAIAAAVFATGACSASDSGPLFTEVAGGAGAGGGGGASASSSESASSAGGAAPVCDEPPSGPCEACVDASCCGPKIACGAGTACASFDDCARAAGCLDDADFYACAAKACPEQATTSAVHAFEALAACAQASCGDAC